MAVLGITNISTTLVKNALSESVTNVSGLVKSINLNPWGINSPLPPQQTRCWGISPQTAPYELGMFRQYDHLWRCYGTGIPALNNDNITYGGISQLNFNTAFFPSWSTATSGVVNHFDVFFSRNGNFLNAAYYTQIGTAVTITDNGSYGVNINPQTPPDSGSALTVDSYVYLRFKYVSGDARRWDSRNFSNTSTCYIDSNDSNAFICKIWVGHDIYTYVTSVSIDSNGTLQIAKTAAAEQFMMVGYNGNSSAVTVGINVNVNNLSDFTGAKNLNWTGGVTIPAATRSGGVLTLGSATFTAVGAITPTQWSIGDNFFGRVMITSVIGSGTYNSAWQSGYNGVITANLSM